MNSKHPLGALIESVQRAKGWSDRDLERQAERAGVNIAKSSFSGYKNKPMHAVKADVIRGLAATLGVSETLVASAALATIGIDLDPASTQTSLEIAVTQDDSLEPRDKAAILALLAVFRQSEVVEDVQAAEVEEVQGYVPGSSSPQKSGFTRNDVIDRPWERLTGAERDAAIADLIANGYEGYELVAANPDDLDDTDAFEGA